MSNQIAQFVQKPRNSVAPKRLSKQQRLDLLELIDAVNGDDLTSRKELVAYMSDNELPEWMAFWAIYSAGENMPGYMPDSPYCLFLTDRAARGYCRELEPEPGGGYVSDYMPATLYDVLS